MKKDLYIAATSFQLITLINLKKQRDNYKGDLIIIINSVPDCFKIKKRLEKYNIFEKIYLMEEYDSRLKTVFNGKQSLFEYIRLVFTKKFTTVKLENYILNNLDFDIKNYIEGFCYNRQYCKWLIDNGIEFNIIDEGIGTYVSSSVYYKNEVKKIFLYNPNYADYYSEFKDKIVNVSKLNIQNTEIKNILNGVFDYNNVCINNNDMIFFDQPYRKNNQWLKEVLKYFPFLLKSKKYQDLFQSGNINEFSSYVINDLKRFKEFCIKPHPRIDKNQLNWYKKENIRILASYNIPWEIILFNNLDKEIKLISFNSTATLSPFLYFEEGECKCKSYFLYSMFLNKYCTDDNQYKVNVQYIYKFFSNNIYVINTLDEINKKGELL